MKKAGLRLLAVFAISATLVCTSGCATTGQQEVTHNTQSSSAENAEKPEMSQGESIIWYVLGFALGAAAAN